jgi:hypothetical protein
MQTIEIALWTVRESALAFSVYVLAGGVLAYLVRR